MDKNEFEILVSERDASMCETNLLTTYFLHKRLQSRVSGLERRS